jgi:N6-L-threonylcarbamoyladenine synthase
MRNKKIVLGIETSCDETAVGIVSDHKEILANQILSQFEEHEQFGGVVPEIAARAHLENLDGLIVTAMEEAGITFQDLSGIAATCGPGLIGGVMIGMMSGKAIAASQSLPFLAVNHLEAHALTPRLTHELEFPYLLLLVSGGHTQILIVEGLGSYRLLGTTLDDALGECFDKSAKVMGLGYPGGPEIEKQAMKCQDWPAATAQFSLPCPMKGRPDCDLSFSGLKTAMRNHVKNTPSLDLPALCAAFQTTVSSVLKDRCQRALDLYARSSTDQLQGFVISGGVAANKPIRSSLANLAQENGLDFFAPPLHLCADNGVMIAWTGIEKLKQDMKDPLNMPARPRWPLDQVAEKSNA